MYMFFFLHIRYFQYSADMKNGLLKGAQSILQLKIDKILNLSILDEIDPYIFIFISSILLHMDLRLNK